VGAGVGGLGWGGWGGGAESENLRRGSKQACRYLASVIILRLRRKPPIRGTQGSLPLAL
jgi:hypothetical protein